jgi:murein DD-endopeptidase MepM/ murein hydrolase activator NlpD
MQPRKTGILTESTQLPSRPKRIPLSIGFFIVSALAVVAATADPPGGNALPFEPETVIEQLGTPGIETISLGSSLPYVYNERILPGDTLQSIFRRLGVEDEEAWTFLNNNTEMHGVLRQLRAGRSLVAMVAPDGKLVSLNLPISRSSQRFIFKREGANLVIAGGEAIDVDTLVEMRSGVITHSLFGATDSAGVPDSIASRFAEIFGTQIDFSKDIRTGDQFSVVYETVYDNGIPVRTGRILAAEFKNQGKTHRVILHREADGNEAYYTPDGRGLNQAFLRYPLEFTRISSNFGRRMHPIHNRWRSHNGTDFAAPTGTPIMASSDGRVSFVGNQNGYGKTIIVQHRDGYSTLYAHLNGFARGLKNGQRVRQGDTIGYVGMTGWATGPHLHYEIRVNNVPRDPMKVALPPVKPLEQRELAAFRLAAEPMLARLDLLNHEPARVASAAR